MSKSTVFEIKADLPIKQFDDLANKLLGFESRYARIKKQVQLLLQVDELELWSKQKHGKKIALIDLLADQYPLAIFHGDVGTGKTANAEAIVNRLARDAKIEDALLFKLSNKVRGTGKVGEMGTLLTQAWAEVAEAAGKNRRAILIIDEGDSIASSRSQSQSHHEDKVAVNTLIQGIDELRKYKGRILVILCTNRLSILDAALRRRAAGGAGDLHPDQQRQHSRHQGRPAQGQLGHGAGKTEDQGHHHRQRGPGLSRCLSRHPARAGRAAAHGKGPDARLPRDRARRCRRAIRESGRSARLAAPHRPEPGGPGDRQAGMRSAR